MNDSNQDSTTSQLLSVLISNDLAAIERIVAVLRRRGLGVTSWTILETENPGLLRIVCETDIDPAQFCQCINQLEKIIDVVEVDSLRPGTYLALQVALIRLEAVGPNQDEATVLVTLAGGRLLSLAFDSFIAELIGDRSGIDRTLASLNRLGNVEVVRTRLIAIRK